jgi:hypothetical protein
MKPEITEDIDLILRFIRGERPSYKADLYEAADRVEAWKATYSNKDI